MQDRKIINKQAILLVDDSEDDLEVTLRALKRAGDLHNPIFTCSSGDEALDFLFNLGEYEDPQLAPRPGLILLDLNMPGHDGKYVLEKIKSDVDTKSIPVVVLTTSSHPADIEHCYALGVNTFITKPVDLKQFYDVINCLKEYWINVSFMPSGEH